MMSGVADLGHGVIPCSQGKSKTKEYRVLISNNSAPSENRFNRSRNVSEFEEDLVDNDGGTDTFILSSLVSKLSSISIDCHFFTGPFRHSEIPIFIMNRQILV
jgi:hypothetical protein